MNEFIFHYNTFYNDTQRWYLKLSEGAPNQSGKQNLKSKEFATHEEAILEYNLLASQKEFRKHEIINIDNSPTVLSMWSEE